MAELAVGEGEVGFMYMGGACVILALPGYSLVFDPADYLTDEDIEALRGTVITLFSHALDDHFHARAVMKLVDIKGSLVIGTEEVCREVRDFVPSTRMTALKPRRGVRLGALRIYALEAKHEVPTNMYYVVWGPSVLFAGDTGYVPLSKLKAQLAFLAAGGGSPVASPSDAAKMAMDLNARHVVPIHCEPEEAKEVAELLRDKAEVIVPEPQKPYKLRL